MHDNDASVQSNKFAMYTAYDCFAPLSQQLHLTSSATVNHFVPAGCTVKSEDQSGPVRFTVSRNYLTI